MVTASESQSQDENLGLPESLSKGVSAQFTGRDSPQTSAVWGVVADLEVGSQACLCSPSPASPAGSRRGRSP